MTNKKKLNAIVNAIVDFEASIEEGFSDIIEISKRCKFSNCTHTKEPNCAVKKAISEGVLLEDRFNEFYRQIKEKEHIMNQNNKTKAIDYMKQRKLFQEPPK
jgi:putative ribosome biogenesis GTPase RsgA